MADSVNSPDLAVQPWLETLRAAPKATSWGQLEQCRQILLNPAALPLAHEVGARLAALQQSFMAPGGSRTQFDEASHGISEALGAGNLPEQAVLVAYADLSVLRQAAEGRWPQVAVERGPEGSAEAA